MQFEGQGEESGETLVYTVTDIADDKVVRRRQPSARRPDAAFRLHGHGGARGDRRKRSRTGTCTGRMGIITESMA